MSVTPAERQRRRQTREQSRAAILAAADEKLRARPFRELTVEELMRGTGLGRTVFYRHFADLHQMVLELLQEIGAELLEFGADWAAHAGDFEDEGRGQFVHAVEYFAEHGPLIRAVADAAASDEELERIYQAWIERFQELTAEGIERLIAQGRIAPLDARDTARALTLLNERYLLDTFGREPRGTASRAVDTLWTIWHRTIMQPPPTGERSD